MDSGLRALSTREKEILEKLLERDFQGRDELRSQLASVLAEQTLPDGTLFLYCTAGSPAPTKYAVAMEATCADADGKDIGILLHVNKYGFMSMLEMIKYDSTPILDPPSANRLVLIDPA